MNDKGIPVPLIRDNGKGSVSLTMLFISFNLVVIGVIGKYSKMLGDVDVSQSLNLMYASAALYFGRKVTKDSKGNTVIESSDQKNTSGNT
jgi:hypothetical protein